jgi:uncharacterized coiled-coil DUF342 family protein
MTSYNKELEDRVEQLEQALHDTNQLASAYKAKTKRLVRKVRMFSKAMKCLDMTTDGLCSEHATPVEQLSESCEDVGESIKKLPHEIVDYLTSLSARNNLQVVLGEIEAWQRKIKDVN